MTGVFDPCPIGFPVHVRSEPGPAAMGSLIRAADRCGRLLHRSRYRPVSVDYLIRAARITDIDRLVALWHAALPPDGGTGPMVSGDLLRQLVYLPQASVVVAEEGRDLVGGAVLALRPSVQSGGYVGTVDLLAVDPRRDVDRVTAALIEEVLRSARNKGCTVVEAARPIEAEERSRWHRLGFTEADPRLERPVAAMGAVARP